MAAGIMTIGAYGFDYSTGPNPDLLALMECHEELCTDLQLKRDAVQVSMGMSDDFDRAVSGYLCAPKMCWFFFSLRAQLCANS